MANHRRPSKKKLAPSIVLLFSIFSVTSPLAFLFSSEENKDYTPTSSPTPRFAADMPKINAAAVLSKAKRVAPTYTAITPLSSAPPPSTSRTTSPQVAQESRTIPDPPSTASTRQSPTQRATSSTLTAVRRPPSATATPTPTKIVLTKPPPPPPPTTKRITQTIPTKTTTKETTADPPKAPSPQPLRSSPSHQLLAQIAQKYVNRGIPYQRGGNSLSGGMDCSHFVWMVLKEAGYNVPYHSSSGLAEWTRHTNDPQPGDLVLFVGHVGIYVSPGMMIDQGSSGGAHLREFKYYNNFIGYGRLPI